jgi:hypothetical protein
MIFEGPGAKRKASGFSGSHAWLIAIVLVSGVGWQAGAAEELLLEVREQIGMARPNFSVAHRIELPRAISRRTAFAMFDDENKPVNAQFTPDGDADNAGTWWIDFQSNIGPWAARRYIVRYGDGIQPGPTGAGGHRITESEDAFVLTKGSKVLTWTVPRDLAGLLRSVDFPPDEHLRPDSPGLVVRDRAGQEHVLGAGFHTGRITRSGQRAAALRFTGAARNDALAGVRSTVDLTFPSPVSWVEVDWTIEDPGARLAGLGAVLRMDLTLPERRTPTLVDFGVGTWVYASLLADQAAELRALPPALAGVRGEPIWQILRGSSDRMNVIAMARPVGGGSAEGWIHIMDRRRCLDLAVDKFGEHAADRITLGGKGDVAVWRDFSGSPTTRTDKRLRFWLHFVFYPPQWSAATSPLMMLSAPEVRTIKGGRADLTK